MAPKGSKYPTPLGGQPRFLHRFLHTRGLPHSDDHVGFCAAAVHTTLVLFRLSVKQGAILCEGTTCGCRAECGLMQQLVLVTLVLDDYTAAPSPACRKLLKDNKLAAVVIGEAPFGPSNRNGILMLHCSAHQT